MLYSICDKIFTLSSTFSHFFSLNIEEIREFSTEQKQKKGKETKKKKIGERRTRERKRD